MTALGSYWKGRKPLILVRAIVLGSLLPSTDMVATDAACEGLNLQTLGTLINVDLPWNPTKLEQRIGRIKRFGQTRDHVDMLNLVNEQTVGETVYQRLSERMRNRFDLFGSLPDTIKDDWIDDIETLGEKMDEYIDTQRIATGFDLRYNATLRPTKRLFESSIPA